MSKRSRRARCGSPAGAETVRPGRELRFVVRLQQETHHLPDQFVRPGRQPQGPQASVLLRDVHPPDRGEPVTLGLQQADNLPDSSQAHPVGCLPVDPGRHRSAVGVDAPVGHQEQLFAEQLPIQPFQRQTASAPVAQDTEHCVSALHFAYLPGVAGVRTTCAPSPCERLSRSPRPGVTPATTTGTPSPPAVLGR